MIPRIHCCSAQHGIHVLHGSGPLLVPSRSSIDSGANATHQNPSSWWQPEILGYGIRTADRESMAALVHRNLCCLTRVWCRTSSGFTHATVKTESGRAAKSNRSWPDTENLMPMNFSLCGIWLAISKKRVPLSPGWSPKALAKSSLGILARREPRSPKGEATGTSQPTSGALMPLAQLPHQAFDLA